MHQKGRENEIWPINEKKQPIKNALITNASLLLDAKTDERKSMNLCDIISNMV